MSTEVARLAYDVTKPSDRSENDKAPIIMLHGLTTTKETWRPFTQELADQTGRKVYTLDARNHGDSEWKEGDSCLEMAKDVIHFMGLMSIPTAVVIGHSMGGKTAMILALFEPDKVEKLVIEDISPKPVEPGPCRCAYYYLQLLRNCLEIIPPDSDLETAGNIVYEYMRSNISKKRRDSDQLSRENVTPFLPLEKKADGFAWKFDLDSLDRVIYLEASGGNAIAGTYDRPSLFICGTNSGYNILNDRELIQEHFPNSSLVRVEGATHLVHYEYPEEFLKAVLDFLK